MKLTDTRDLFTRAEETAEAAALWGRFAWASSRRGDAVFAQEHAREAARAGRRALALDRAVRLVLAGVGA